MSGIYIIRAILDADEDVIRDLAIESSASLFDLHHLMVKAFELDAGEMSSFFRSNEDWDQGQEISMMDFDPSSGRNALEELAISEAFEKEESRMLFAYDYMNLWTFYLEATDLAPEGLEPPFPRVIGRIGQRPNEAPQKEMKAMDLMGDEDFDMDEEDHLPEEDDDLWN